MRFSIPAVLIGALCVLDALCVLGASSAMRTATAAEEAPHAPARTAPHASEQAAHPSLAPTRPSEAPRTTPGRSVYLPRSAAPRAAYPTGATGSATRPRMNNGLALDARYNHGRYYAPVGTVTRVLPPDHRPYYLHGQRYYYSSGVWYATRGVGFVVVAAPVGIVLSGLPSFCTTVWYGGVPYYYADNTYYAWQPDQNGYAVVDPPDGSSAAPPDGGAPDAAPPDGTGAGAPPGSSNADFLIYPKNGQSKDQQAADEYDCGNWARSQTGFDPSLPDGGVTAEDADRSHSNYDRAMAACLQGRGYQLN